MRDFPLIMRRELSGPRHALKPFLGRDRRAAANEVGDEECLLDQILRNWVELL